ncbi:MAG: hypothetical protein J7K54_05180 [Candidatus Aenigmarchaeota archaeon]|nr:hypothetical protein [Candidatus Aenigmarchaeota archaeon]
MRKAQMFIVTAVFLSAMLFTVQQIFLAYSLLDMSRPYNTEEVYIAKNIMDAVNDTIKQAPDCWEFQKNLDELIVKLRDDVSADGYFLELDYTIDCTRWSATSGKAPLSLSVRLSQTYDSEGIVDFYHL